LLSPAGGVIEGWEARVEVEMKVECVEEEVVDI